MAARQKTVKSRAAPAAYFLSLTVENVRCFGKKQSLDLSNGQGGPARWTVILGDNGVGKTTLLQSMVASQPESQKRRTPPNHVRFWMPIRGRGKNKIVIDTEYAVGSRLDAARKRYQIRKCMWSREKTGRGSSFGDYYSEFSLNETESFSIFAYGAARKMPNRESPDRVWSHGTESLFYDDIDLLDPEGWLLKADYTAQRSTRIKKRAEAQVDKIKEILIRLLPDISDIRISNPRTTADEPRAEAKTPYGWVPFPDLGLGYKTLIAWVTDFANRLFVRYPDSDDPLAEPAIALVDEIDLHMHPRWQRTILNYLSERFTNTQFIVTAHSPLIVQSAQNPNIVVLRREGNQVVIDNDVETVRGWRVDQVLTSDLFGFETARPAKLEPLIQERKKLLTKSKLRKTDKERLRQLEHEIGDLPAGDTQEDRRAMDIIRRAARHIEKSGD